MTPSMSTGTVVLAVTLGLKTVIVPVTLTSLIVPPSWVTVTV